MFTLRTIDENNIKEDLLFDHRRCKLYNKNGSLLYPRAIFPINSFFRSIFRYKIVLGRNCNFRCKYCSQNDNNYNDPSPTKKQIDNVIEYVVNDAYLNHTDKENLLVNFWGGEPTLYKDYLIYITEQLKIKIPRISFSIITNGYLLNDTVLIDHFNKYDFGISLSHDGPGQHLRTKDPFENKDTMENIIEFFKKGKLNINPTISIFNYDIEALNNFFCNKLQTKDAKILLFHLLTNVESLDLHKYRLNNQQRNKYRNSALTTLIDTPENYYLLYDKISTFINYMTNDEYCESRDKNDNFNNEDKCVTIDLFGNILYNEIAYPSSVSEMGESLLLGNINDLTIKSKKKIVSKIEDKCLTCPIVFFCKFRYPCAKNSDREFECELNIDEGFVSLQAACLFSTGKFITEIISSSGKVYTWNLSE